MTVQTFEDYQKAAQRTMPKDLSFYDTALMLCMGLAGEVGEVIEQFKKAFFHGHYLVDEKVINELGDVLWYLANLTALMGVKFDTVAQCNIDKLKKRYPDGFSEERSRNRDEGEQLTMFV